MKTAREYFYEDNKKVLEVYEKELLEIKNIYDETNNYVRLGQHKEYCKFLNQAGSFILKLSDIEKNYDRTFETKSFEELKKENYDLYKEIIGDNYKSSYANPTYAVSALGEDLGKALSAYYVRIREGISFAFKHRIFDLESTNRVFIELYNLIKNNDVKYEKVKNVINKPFLDRETLITDEKCTMRQRRDKEFGFYSETILNYDLTDLRYLFKLDKYISENEIKTAEFLSNYSKEKIKTLSKATVDAYLRGFIVEGKNRGDRNIARVLYSAGHEIIIKQMINDFKSVGFKCTVLEVESTNPNKQYDYDHRYDRALYLNEEYTRMKEEAYEQAGKLCSDVFKASAGPLFFDRFGEKPFSPEIKNDCLKLSKEQEKLWQSHTNNLDQIYSKLEPNEETSFCIIALPSPEIGVNFEEIFEDTLSINMMDNTKYEKLQQTIIDVLDKGEYVHIKGRNGNETDIKVKLQRLKNPEKETNFVNCVADVNVPLGEVYTTPELKGTNGVLHLKDTFLDLKYENLKLVFKDGYVTQYSCSNLETEKENIEYIKENLMVTHESLPLGEFAIGTNTTAYVMAQKYGIIEVLPILIIEKMGPHFAIGDTCFMWAEDLPVYNILNNKEVVARDNEKSILRKEDKNKAYTGVHTDITIPYEEIEFIDVLTVNEERIGIIKDGRFVLKGTEELNNAFDKRNK